jgi:PAS domain S-box-containing protein
LTIEGGRDLINRNTGRDEQPFLRGPRRDPVGGDKSKQVPQDDKLRQILETAKTEWEAAFDAISEGIVIVDAACKIRRVNRALATLLGRDIRALVGLACCELFPHHRADEKACPVQNFPAGKQGTFEVFFPDYRFYEESVHPIVHKGKNRGYVITVKDVTRERLADQERRHVYLQMEEAARKQKEAEEARDDARSELAAVEKTATLGKLAGIVSLEINRGMRMIQDGLDLLAERCNKGRRAEAVEFAGVVAELSMAATRARDILDKLAQLRIEESDSLDEIDLNHLVSEIVQETAALSGQAGVQVVLNLGDPPRVEGIRAQIGAVLSSLLLNAIEATSAGKGTVTLATGKEKQFARVVVADNGKGILAENLPKVFNPFFTTASDRSKVGLGLTICQAIVQGHRGHIRVDSEPGSGTTVKLLLPA